MQKIAIILIFVGLTMMVSAYNSRQPYFDQNAPTGKQDELVLPEEEDELVLTREQDELGIQGYII